MMQKIKMLMIGAIVAGISMLSGVVTFGLLAQPVMAATCPSGTVRSGASVNNLAECNVEKDESLMPTIWQIINVALGVLGIVAVAVIILGGVSYMTSSGDAAKITKAKNTILYGIVGLVIALLAFAIVNFVLVNIFG